MNKTHKAESGNTNGDNDQKWNANAYAKRKAQRANKNPAEWATSPATGERFYLRRVGALGLAMSGQLSHSLTNRAVESWKESGLDVGESEGDGSAANPEDRRREGQKNIEFATRIALEACVIPRLGRGEGELDPAFLDDADLLFIVDWATTPAGTLPLRGGEAVSVESLDRFPSEPGKRSGAGAGG